MMSVDMIYFDMDGVLADFDRGVRELCGMETPKQDLRSKEQDDRMWERIREVGHFYDKLELIPGAKEMFDRVYGKYGTRCEILTGIPKEKRRILTAGDDKKAWMKRVLSESIVVNICLREEKIRKCTGSDVVLIDDLEKNIREWEDAGGTGIRFVNAEQTMKELREKGIL